MHVGKKKKLKDGGMEEESRGDEEKKRMCYRNWIRKRRQDPRLQRFREFKNARSVVCTIERDERPEA